MSSEDEAPESSRAVRNALGRSELEYTTIERMQITTRITHNNRAETSVRQPPAGDPELWGFYNRVIREALLKLPGADGVPFAGVGQTHDVTWDGICRPF